MVTIGYAAFTNCRALASIDTEAAIVTYSSSSWNFYFKEITKDLLHP